MLKHHRTNPDVDLYLNLLTTAQHGGATLDIFASGASVAGITASDTALTYAVQRLVGDGRLAQVTHDEKPTTYMTTPDGLTLRDEITFEQLLLCTSRQAAALLGVDAVVLHDALAAYYADERTTHASYVEQSARELGVDVGRASVVPQMQERFASLIVATQSERQHRAIASALRGPGAEAF